jgi:hypothetical protein
MDFQEKSNSETCFIQDWDLYESVSARSKTQIDDIQKLFLFALGKSTHIQCRDDLNLRELLNFVEEKSTT